LQAFISTGENGQRLFVFYKWRFLMLADDPISLFSAWTINDFLCGKA
jgi:hypothetical protein